MADNVADFDGSNRDERGVVGDVLWIYGCNGSAKQEGFPSRNRHRQKEEVP